MIGDVFDDKDAAHSGRNDQIGQIGELSVGRPLANKWVVFRMIFLIYRLIQCLSFPGVPVLPVKL
jgi:hypothetical protein